MRKHELYTNYHDHFEYFGNTEIERIRKQGEKTIRHDWLIFDSVDEAMDYFNDKCGEFVGYYAGIDFELSSNLHYQRIGDFINNFHGDIKFITGNLDRLLTYGHLD